MEEECPIGSSKNLRSFLQNYQQETLLNKLGEGTYGLVYKMFDIKKKIPVALKKIKLDIGDDQGIPSTSLREISALKALKHQNIIDLIDQKYSMPDRRLYLVFEFIEYDLRKYIDNKFPFPIQTLKLIIFQILSGLSYCHSHSILHRDMKPQNVLINEKGQVKLADFGLARNFSFPIPKFTKEIATLWYRAPELMLGDDSYGTGLDIWSTGCIMAEMVTSKPLFPGDSQIDTLFKIMKILGSPSDGIYTGLSQLPEYRLNFPKFQKQNLSHIFPQLDPQGVEIISSMLQFNPSHRAEAKNLLQHQWFDGVRLIK